MFEPEPEPAPGPAPAPTSLAATETEESSTADSTTGAGPTTPVPDAATASREPLPPGIPITEDVPAASWTMVADWPELAEYPSRDLNRVGDVPVLDGCTVSAGVDPWPDSDIDPPPSTDRARVEFDGFDLARPSAPLSAPDFDPSSTVIDLAVESRGVADLEGADAVSLLIISGDEGIDGGPKRRILAYRPVSGPPAVLRLEASCSLERGPSEPPPQTFEEIEALLRERAAGITLVGVPLEGE